MIVEKPVNEHTIVNLRGYHSAVDPVLANLSPGEMAHLNSRPSIPSRLKIIRIYTLIFLHNMS